MPGGELLHRSAYGWLGDRVEFLCEPALEPGKRFVAGRQDTVVFEQAAQMGGLFVSAGVVEALMGQRNVAGGQPGQQRLDLEGELPGEDAGGPVDTTQRIDDGRHGFWVVRTINHRRSQVVAQGTAGAGFAPVEIGLGPAASAGGRSGERRARPADRLPDAIEGQAGKHTVVTAPWADPAGAHRGVVAAVAQILAGPRRPALVSHPLASTA